MPNATPAPSRPVGAPPPRPAESAFTAAAISSPNRADRFTRAGKSFRIDDYPSHTASRPHARVYRRSVGIVSVCLLGDVAQLPQRRTQFLGAAVPLLLSRLLRNCRIAMRGRAQCRHRRLDPRQRLVQPLLEVRHLVGRGQKGLEINFERGHHMPAEPTATAPPVSVVWYCWAASSSNPVIVSRLRSMFSAPSCQRCHTSPNAEPAWPVQPDPKKPCSSPSSVVRPDRVSSTTARTS